MADALGLEEQHLPFLAELVEVNIAEADWRGAIERAIGGHRLRLLVPTEQMGARPVLGESPRKSAARAATRCPSPGQSTEIL